LLAVDYTQHTLVQCSAGNEIEYTTYTLNKSVIVCVWRPTLVHIHCMYSALHVQCTYMYILCTYIHVHNTCVHTYRYKKIALLTWTLSLSYTGLHVCGEDNAESMPVKITNLLDMSFLTEPPNTYVLHMYMYMYKYSMCTIVVPHSLLDTFQVPTWHESWSKDEEQAEILIIFITGQMNTCIFSWVNQP
jgi:hypothetical protein